MVVVELEYGDSGSDVVRVVVVEVEVGPGLIAFGSTYVVQLDKAEARDATARN